MRLSTANGVVTVDQALDFMIPETEISGEAFVSDTAPAGIGVLSLGKIIRENKFRVWWDEYTFQIHLPGGRVLTAPL